MGISIIGAAPPAGPKEKRVQLFTATGSWTAPAGVTYAIAHIVPGGGGGGGQQTPGVVGTASSAFSIVANPGNAGSGQEDNNNALGGASAGANTGMGGQGSTGRQQFGSAANTGGEGRLIVAGATVIPGTSYTITVGAGGNGAGGGGNGGSGYVAIEFYV